MIYLRRPNADPDFWLGLNEHAQVAIVAELYRQNAVELAELLGEGHGTTIPEPMLAAFVENATTRPIKPLVMVQSETVTALDAIAYEQANGGVTRIEDDLEARGEKLWGDWVCFADLASREGGIVIDGQRPALRAPRQEGAPIAIRFMR